MSDQDDQDGALIVPYTHWAYFQAHEQATACGAELTGQDFLTGITPADDITDGRHQWLLRASMRVVVDHLDERHDHVRTVVERHGGMCDFGETGWYDPSIGQFLHQDEPALQCGDSTAAQNTGPEPHGRAGVAVATPAVLELTLLPELPIDSTVCHPAKPRQRYQCWHNPNAGRNPTVWSSCSPTGDVDRRAHCWWFSLFCQFGGLVEVVSTPASCGIPDIAILSWQVPTEPPVGVIVGTDDGNRYQRRHNSIFDSILWAPSRALAWAHGTGETVDGPATGAHSPADPRAGRRRAARAVHHRGPLRRGAAGHGPGVRLVVDGHRVLWFRGKGDAQQATVRLKPLVPWAADAVDTYHRVVAARLGVPFDELDGLALRTTPYHGRPGGAGLHSDMLGAMICSIATDAGIASSTGIVKGKAAKLTPDRMRHTAATLLGRGKPDAGVQHFLAPRRPPHHSHLPAHRTGAEFFACLQDHGVHPRSGGVMPPRPASWGTPPRPVRCRKRSVIWLLSVRREAVPRSSSRTGGVLPFSAAPGPSQVAVK